MAASEGSSGVETRFNEGADSYELGSEIDGAWHVFFSTPGAAVRAAVENVRTNEAAQGEGSPPATS